MYPCPQYLENDALYVDIIIEDAIMIYILYVKHVVRICGIMFEKTEMMYHLHD